MAANGQNTQEKYNGIEKYIYSDVYRFFLKYKDCPNTDNTWESIIKDGDSLYKKYQAHPLASKMVMCTMDQLEHIITKKAAKGFTREEWEVKLKSAKESIFK